MTTNIFNDWDSDDPLDSVIELLEFSVQTHTKLKDANVNFVRNLVQLNEEDLRIAGFTPTMIEEIKATLDMLGHWLGME